MAVLVWGTGTYGTDYWGPWDVVDIPPIVRASGYKVRRELYRASISNQLVEDISAQFVDGSVDMNLDRAVKQAASLTVRDPWNISDTDYLAPFLRRIYDDGRPDDVQQCGLFAIKSPPGTYNRNDAVATFEGSDLTSVMARTFLTDAKNLNTATNWRNAINQGITESGILRHSMPATSATFPSAQTFPIGTSQLEKSNTLLSQLGWYHLGTDLTGRVGSPGPPQDLASKEPWRTLTDGDDGDIVGNIEVTYPGLGIANIVLVVNNDPTVAPMSATARNDDPQSPTSTVNKGEIMRREYVTGSTTQEALQATADRFLAESRSYYRVVKLTILHDPAALNLHQVVQLDLTGEQASLSGRYWVRVSSLGFTPDKPTTLECNQLTSDVLEAVI